jgi:hypothetical protein
MTRSTIASIEVIAATFFAIRYASGQDLLAGRERAMTAPKSELLVGRARRFTSLVTQMHMEVTGPLHARAPQPPIAVFATRYGEIQTGENLMVDYRNLASVSSARFALSVHNTPSGLYSVATGSIAPSTTITGANAIAAGWLEAALTVIESGRTVLLSIADEPIPEVFKGPPEPLGVAAGFLLGPASPMAYRAQLATVADSDGHTDPTNTERDSISTQQVLARAVDAWSCRESITMALGAIQRGKTLQLQLIAQGAGNG